jgi:hypothetical protein
MASTGTHQHLNLVARPPAHDVILLRIKLSLLGLEIGAGDSKVGSVHGGIHPMNCVATVGPCKPRAVPDIRACAGRRGDTRAPTCRPSARPTLTNAVIEIIDR